MKDLSWVNNPAMKNIDAKKLRVIVNLLNEVEGQSLETSIPSVMRANQELRQQGLTFTPQEQTVIFDVICKNLPAAQRQKLELYKSMMNFNNI